MDRYTRFKVACAISGTRIVVLARLWGVTQPSVTRTARGFRSRNIEAKIDAFCSQVFRDYGVNIHNKAA